MDDLREKVTYSIERCICHVPDACRDCSYDNEPYPKCSEHLLRDAHDLLKAQEPVAPEEYTVIVSQYGNAEHKCYRCGACKCGLIRNTNWRQKYCPECGRAVKWPEPPKEENT